MSEMKEHVVTEEDKKLVSYFYEKIYSNGDNLSCAYDELAAIYDKINSIMKYEVFKTMASDLATFLKHEDLESKKILDLGSGSGLLGEALKKEGFRKIDGLDISENMLKMCERTGCYEKLYHLGLTTEPTPGIEDNTYDIVASTGCYVVGHIPMDTLLEVARIVKPGGYIFYTLHDPNYKLDYMNWQGKLMQQKKAELISMQLKHYRLDANNNYKPTNCHFVLFKVL